MPKKPKGKSRGARFEKKRRPKVRQVSTNEASSSKTQAVECPQDDSKGSPCQEMSACEESSLPEDGNVSSPTDVAVQECDLAVQEPEIALWEPQMVVCDQETQNVDKLSFVQPEITVEDGEPMEVEFGAPHGSEIGNVIQEVQITNISDVSPNISTVSDIIVIGHITDNSNIEKPWFPLEDPIFEHDLDPLSPTSVLVLPVHTSPSQSEVCSPVQDGDKPEDPQQILSVASEECHKMNTPSSPSGVLSPPGVSHRHLSLERGDPPTGTTHLLLEVRNFLKLLLPNRWTSFVLHEGIHVGLLADVQPSLIQRALFFSPDGTISASVNGKDLPADHEFWGRLQKSTLTADTTREYSEFICKIVDRFRSYELCKGVEDFQSVWKTAENVEIDRNRFHEYRFTITCRSLQCSMLVQSIKFKRCAVCSTLWGKLKKRSGARESCTKTPERKLFQFLSTPQKKRRILKKNAQIRRLRVANARYKQKIKEIIKKEGIHLDDQTAQDFIDILSDETRTAKLTDFQRLFIQQQLKASSVKGATGMRWHPAIIRLALSVSMTSPAAYDELSGFIKLPSRRQLFDYSHAMESKGIYDFFHFLDVESNSSLTMSLSSGSANLQNVITSPQATSQPSFSSLN